MASGSQLVVIFIQQAGFIYISAVWVTPRPPRPLKRLVISVRCVWLSEWELDAVWVSCSACLLFVTGLRRRWMSLSLPITPLFAAISYQAGFHPLWSLFVSNRLENLRSQSCQEWPLLYSVQPWWTTSVHTQQPQYLSVLLSLCPLFFFSSFLSFSFSHTPAVFGRNTLRRRKARFLHPSKPICPSSLPAARGLDNEGNHVGVNMPACM